MEQRHPHPWERETAPAQLGAGSQSDETGAAQGPELFSRKLRCAVELAATTAQVEARRDRSNLRQDRVVGKWG